MEVSWEYSAEIRITSYNVCYTKLLRVLLGGLVLSHWVLDLVVHRPDLPLLPGVATKVGLGLWNSVAATMVVEGLIFIGGVWLYQRATEAVNGKGRWGFLGLVAFLRITSYNVCYTKLLRPLGGAPRYAPVCVPWPVHRTTADDPSMPTTTSSTVAEKSGNAS